MRFCFDNTEQALYMYKSELILFYNICDVAEKLALKRAFPIFPVFSGHCSQTSRVQLVTATHLDATKY